MSRKDKEEQKDYMRAYYQANKARCLANGRKWQAKNSERLKQAGQTNYQRLRNRVFAVLGNACVRCGFDDTRALCLDHLNGGGREELRRLKYPMAVYLKAIKTGGEGYQILCANCNAIKRIENREHGSEKTEKRTE